MAKRKKIEPINGIGKDPQNDLTIQKSYALSDLWRSDMSLPEFKLLDAYLARIDSHKPDKRQVTLEKGEIERALGMKKLNQKDLMDRLCKLGTGIKVPDPTKRSGFRIVWLLEEAKGCQDDNAQWTVTLEANKKALDLFFGVEKPGYFRYKLRCVSGMTSRYTYVLFMYLEQNRHKHLEWDENLDKLKENLDCTAETYDEFYRFNDLILKRCHKEIIKKTECKFTYSTIKKGRCVVAIHFAIQPLSPAIFAADEPEPEQFTLLGSGEDGTESDGDLLSDACNGDFTAEEIAQLRSVIVTVPEQLLPTVSSSDSLDIRRYHYLDQRYKTMLTYDSRNKQNKIKNRFAYLLAMIKSDAGIK